MANFFDYIAWRGDLSFNKSRTNRVDCCLFSQIVMLDFEGIVPNYPSHETITFQKAKNKYSELKSDIKELGLIVPNTIIEALYKSADTKRYRDLELSNYINLIDEKKEEQFCALTIRIDKDLAVIALCATDDSVIGWKENFNMIYESPISSQLSAVEYIENVMKNNEGEFIICGHSKGGNLALYGGTHIDDEDLNLRIRRIYNFDGPGISSIGLKKDDFKTKLSKAKTIIPQGSMIGRLFEHKEKCEIVKSTMQAMYQHDTFSWEILGKDFIYEKELTKESNEIDKKIKQILLEMNEIDKKKFVSGLYSLMTISGCKSLLELNNHKKDLLSAYFKMDREDRKYVSTPIKKLFKDRAVQLFFIKAIKEARQVNK